MPTPLETYLAVYGADFKRQFRQKSAKYQIEFEDVMQEAARIYFEVAAKHDPAKGPQMDFLWGYLNKRLVALSYGALRFAASLDDDSAQGMAIRKEVGSIFIDQPDLANTGHDVVPPELTEFYTFAEKISGQSTTQLAKRWKVTTRRVNQIIQQLCNQATVIRSSRASQNGHEMAVHFPTSRKRHGKIRYGRGIPKSCAAIGTKVHTRHGKAPK